MSGNEESIQDRLNRERELYRQERARFLEEHQRVVASLGDFSGLERLKASIARIIQAGSSEESAAQSSSTRKR